MRRVFRNQCSRSILKNVFIPLVTTFSISLAAGASNADDLERGMLRDLQVSRNMVSKAEQSLKKDGSCSAEITALKKKAEEVRAAHILMEERLAAFSTQAEELGGKALDRQNAVAKGYVEAISEYLAMIDALPPDGSVSLSTLESIRKIIDTIAPRKKRPIIGTLPYTKLRYPAKEPDTANTITPAYLGGSQTATPEDSASSPEAPISEEIANLAESLGFSPVLIYEWVKNNVDTEWYWGCMKGAEETLRQKSGNDSDQAALLTALLRASGFPTRYVRGVLEFFPDMEKAKNLTSISDPANIASFFQRSGIPFKPVIGGGKIANFQIEHVWVESLIPYSNYRGTVIDDLGKTWIALDTSIKPSGYNRNTPPDITAGLALDTVRDAYLQASQTQTPLEYIKTRAEQYLALNKPQNSWHDLLHTKIIVPEVLKILPATLQFRQVAVTGEYTSIPEALRQKVRFTASDSARELFTVTLDAFSLAGKKTIITYEPETVEDQRIIDSYGGLGNTPSYLVRLRPVLKVNDVRIIVAQDGLPMGAGYSLAIEVITPNGTEKSVSGQIVGNVSAIAVVPQKTAEDTKVEASDSAETLLYKEARGYVNRWNKSEEELAALLGLSISRPIPTIATVGNLVDVSYILDAPHDFQWKGVFLDANLRGVEVVAGNGDRSREKSFMGLSSLEGSILENRIFEEDFQVESVSTAKLMQLAATGGTPILTIDKTNIDTLLPDFPFDDEVKSDIRNAAQQGLTVTIPETEITYEDWDGVGYIKENPESGESGWMLTGMVAGGMTVVGIDRWNEIFRDDLMEPYSEPPNRDPSSAVSIRKITASDLQFGEVGDELDIPLQVIVKDNGGKPVENAPVTFNVLAGGGSFGGGVTDITVLTGKDGIASTGLTLGQKTSYNPAFFAEEEDKYFNRYGANIVDAYLGSGTAITVPFTAYGIPRSAVTMRKIYGDGKSELVLSYAGFVSLAIEDEFGNPIANLPVTFSTGNVVDNSGCPDDVKDTRPSMLIQNGDACLGNFLTYSKLTGCETAAPSQEIISDIHGASVGVILGGIPGSDYPVHARTKVTSPSGDKELETDFTLKTVNYSRCGGSGLPRYGLRATFIYPTDNYGNNINAAKSGSEVPVKAILYSIIEESKEIQQSISCDGSILTCNNWLRGTGSFADSTDFTTSSLKFGDLPGEAGEDGEFSAKYTLQPGLNEITITGNAEIVTKVNVNSCTSGCSTPEERTVSLTSGTVMQLYGVEVVVKEPEKLFVSIDGEGYAQADTAVNYEITPAEYRAYNATVFVYNGDEIVEAIPSETEGSGQAVISRGFKFDPSGAYNIKIVLNMGTGVKIESDSYPLSFRMPPFGAERIHTLSRFDNPAFPAESFTDSYRTFDFKLDKQASVSVEILDAAMAPKATLVSSSDLAPGEYHFVVHYGQLQGAGFSPALAPQYYLHVREDLGDGNPPRSLIYPGVMSERTTGKMLGQVMVHDVLIQDGSLNLSRQDFAFTGRGPQLEFSRSYTNQETSAWRRYLGNGWGHSLDMQLQPLDRRGSGAGAVPDWVKNAEGRFFGTGEIPTDPPYWTSVRVNGAVFRESSGVWYAERGRHGSFALVGGEYVYTAKDGTRYYYDYPQRDPTPVKRIVDRKNNSMTFTYDAFKRLEKVTDAVNRSCEFRYDNLLGFLGAENSRLMAVTCSDGVEVVFGYNAKGYLTSARRGSRSERYDYAQEPGYSGAPYNLVKATDSNGHSFNYEYFGPGQVPVNLANFVKALKAQDVVKSVTYPDAKSALFAYDVATANKRTVTDLRGKETVYTLNFFGNPLKIEEPLGKTTLMTWSIDENKPDNVMTSKTDPRSFTTTYEYDAQGNIAKETGPYDKSIVTSWNQQFSLPESRTDRNNVVQGWQYDPDNGNLLTYTDGDQKQHRYTYYATGERQTATNPRTYTTSYTWDQYGNPASESGAEGSVTRFENDIRGRRTALTDPNGRTTRYTWDDLDNPATVVYPSRSSYTLADGSGNTKSTVYDPEGNLLSETDRVGLTLTYTYTPRDQVKTISRSTGGMKSFDYDGNGNLTSESDWKGVATTHHYDDLNRRDSTTDRLGHATLMGYDLSGNLTSETDAELRVTTHEYDRLNRLTDTWQPALDGEERGNLHYTYYDEADPKTNLKTERDQEGHDTAYEYNGRYLRTKRTDAKQGVHLWEYDDNGNLWKETDEELRVSRNDYDRQDRLTAVFRTLDGAEISTRYQYDKAGNRTHVIDPNTHVTETRYDEWNRPWKVIDPDSYVTTTELDGEGREIRSIDANLIERTKVRDQRGLVLTATDGERQVTRYSYDDNGNLETVTDAKGVVTRTTYDAEDRKLLTTEAEGMPEERTSGVILYDKVGNAIQVSDWNGNVTRTEYSVLNLPFRVYDPAPFDVNFTESSYYKTGKVKRVIDRRKNATTYEYDELNRLAIVTDPLTKTVVTVYDGVGNVKSLKDKRDIVTVSDYNELNLVKEKRRAGLRLVTNEYDGAGNLRFITDANSHRTENIYNKRNLLITTVFPDTTTEKRSYDGVGNVLTETDEEAKVTTYTYDRENRQRTVELAGETTEKRYDAVGNPVEVIKPEGNSRTMGYDGLRRLTSVSEGGLTTRYEYDGNGNTRHQYDPRGNDVEYTWDELNRKKEHILHRGDGDLVTAFEYDEEGNLNKVTDPKGQVFTYTYDQLNRRSDENLPAAATPFLTLANVHMEYDGNDNVTSVVETKTDSGGATVTDTTTNTYDDFDRLKTSSTRGVSVGYDYDNNGNRTNVSTTSGSTTYTYDPRNRVKTAVAGGTTGFDYYPDGKRKTVSYPNGAAVAYTYFPTDRVKTVVNTGAGDAVISGFAYEYDRNGNRTSQAETRPGFSETTTYDYDDLDRLESFTVANGADTTTTGYTFDGYNRASETVRKNGSTVTYKSYSYDESDRLLNVQLSDAGGNRSISYTYDKNGNTVRKQDTGETEAVIYDYDASNRLVRAMRGATLLGLYDYNSEGLRIRHRNGDRGDVDTWYDGKAVIEERRNGSLLAHYRYAGKPLSLFTSSDTQFYHFDGLGSTVNLTNAAGTQQAGYFLDPWGRIEDQEGDSVNRQIFTGQEHDGNTGLIYFGARYYDPDTARFITEDSNLGEAGTPPSLNRYLYAYSNPTVYVDLLGYAAYFFDGTGNHPNPTNIDGTKNVKTNVRKMYEAYEDEKFYAYGIGSGYSADGTPYKKKWHGGTGWKILNEKITGESMDGRVNFMMKLLEKQLKKGDKVVDVYGFSRGSATALEFLNRIQDQKDKELYKDIEIRFVGLFDTVPSTGGNPLKYSDEEKVSTGEKNWLGFDKKKTIKYRFNLPKDMKFSNTPIHAVSIDEQRMEFATVDLEGALQVGFRGVHSDVGGGYENNRFDWIAMDYMVEKSREAGVKFDERKLQNIKRPGKLLYELWQDYHKGNQNSVEPTDNSELYYNDHEPRRLPRNMLLHPSVDYFESKPKNDIGGYRYLQ